MGVAVDPPNGGTMPLSGTVKSKQLISLFLVLATIGIYWQVLKFDFVGFDDDYFVYENPNVIGGLTGENILWAFTEGTRAGNYWHPLTWLSHILDAEFYGGNPAGHHWTNVILHTANALLLFFIFTRMTGAVWKSGFVAALFALHPLHVEPVAWVAERKELLGMFFCLLAMHAYVRYVERPGYPRYIPIPLFFILSLMSKATAVSFPFFLLLLDFWPLGRWRRGQDIPAHWLSLNPVNAGCLIWEKSTLFMLSGLASVTVFLTERLGGTVPTLETLPFVTRLGNVLISYVEYMGKFFWPVRLAFYYPYPDRIDPAKAIFAGCLLILLSIFFVRLWRRHAYLTMGWFWFLGTFVPMIGWVQAGSFAMADRFTYLPLTGLLVIIAWGFPDLLHRWPWRKTVLPVAATAVFGMMLPVAWLQIGHWKNSIALFEHALAVTEDNWLAYNNLGIAQYHRGQYPAAVDNFRASLKLRPAFTTAHYGLGTTLSKMGRYEEAVFHFQECIRIDPDFKEAYFNIGNIYFRQGRYHEAVVRFAEVLRIDPGAAEAYNQIGFILMRRERYKGAERYFLKALELNPDSINARHNLEALKSRLRKSDGNTGNM